MNPFIKIVNWLLRFQLKMSKKFKKYITRAAIWISAIQLIMQHLIFMLVAQKY